MKGSLATVLGASLWALAGPGGASAQAVIGVGAGVAVPTGGYADVADTGWLAAAGVGFPVGDMPLSIGAYGFYGSNAHESPPAGDKTNLYGALAGVSHAFGDPEGVFPFVGGMVGFMTRSFRSESQPAFEGSESGLAARASAGVGFPLGSIGGFVEAHWLTSFGAIDATRLAGAMAGVRVPLGGGGI
jgi:hypothetical protein